MIWVKGNLHCHTTVSDGKSEPSEVCCLYAERGYDFISITDHNRFVDPRHVDSHGLLLIPGTELSVVPGCNHKIPLHVNGFGIDHAPVPERGRSRARAIQNCIDAIVQAGGIAQINHPNFYYAFDHKVMLQTTGALLLEVCNGHPRVYNEGDATHLGVERMWDHMLSAGMLIYGTGVDDSHHYRGRRLRRRANPFRAWVWARVGRLTVREVLGALARGDFYASTGVELADVVADGERLRVVIEPAEGVRYRTQFIGRHGRVLHQSRELDSAYTLSAVSPHSYVRVKVLASNGARAWTQPHFV